jgi:hypothetical protein
MTNSSQHELSQGEVTAFPNTIAACQMRQLDQSIHIMARDSRFFRQMGRMMTQMELSM